MNSLNVTLVGYLKPFVTKICDVSVRSHSLQTWELAKYLMKCFHTENHWQTLESLDKPTDVQTIIYRSFELNQVL